MDSNFIFVYNRYCGSSPLGNYHGRAKYNFYGERIDYPLSVPAGEGTMTLSGFFFIGDSHVTEYC